jgi:hypothetical protein
MDASTDHTIAETVLERSACMTIPTGRLGKAQIRRRDPKTASGVLDENEQ